MMDNEWEGMNVEFFFKSRLKKKTKKGETARTSKSSSYDLFKTSLLLKLMRLYFKKENKNRKTLHIIVGF